MAWCVSPFCPVCRQRSARRKAMTVDDLVYEQTTKDRWVTSSEVASAAHLDRRTAHDHLKGFVCRGLVEQQKVPGRGGPAGYRRVA